MNLDDLAGDALLESQINYAPTIAGITAGYEDFDIEVTLAELVGEYQRLNKTRQLASRQAVTFDHSPVCIVNFADLHLGHPGVNYRRLLKDIAIVSATPGMYFGIVGDVAEDMILPKLMHARFNGEITPRKEWAVVKHIVALMAPKLIYAVGGNHESWVTTLTGIPYFHEIVKQIAPQVLYDGDDVRFAVRVRNAEKIIRARHQWRYRSKYNHTHGIEDAARFDSDFDIGIGAHTHVSGLVRSFNNHGTDGLALLVGTYKDMDEYPRKLGMPKPNASTAVAVMLWDDGRVQGFDNILTAREFMLGYRYLGNV